MRAVKPLSLLAAIFVAAPAVAAQAPSSSARDSADRQRQSTSDTAARIRNMQPDARIRGQREAQLVLVTSPGRITANPAAFYGLPVSVHANADRVVSPHVFTLDQGGWAGFGGDLAVIVPRPAANAPRLEPSAYVTVVGTVRVFVRAEFERDYDWFDSLPDLNVELDGRPVVIADVVRTSDGAMLAQQPSTPVTRILVATPGDIADVPGRFFGRPVAVADAEIEQAWSPRLFTLDEDQLFAGPDVLVFNPHPAAATTAAGLDDQVVSVFGIVRPLLIAEFESDYDWFDAVNYNAVDLARFERRPVIVASSIIGRDREQLVQFDSALALDIAEREIAAREKTWRTMDTRAPAPARAAGTRNEPAAESAATADSGRRSATADNPGQAGTTGQTNRPPLRDISAMLVAAPEDVLGRRVVLDRVEVRRVMGQDTFIVGPSEVHMVAVRLASAPATTVKAGQYARVEGTLRRSPENASWGTPLYIDAEMFAVMK